jgi:hypothetical protein
MVDYVALARFTAFSALFKIVPGAWSKPATNLQFGDRFWHCPRLPGMVASSCWSRRDQRRKMLNRGANKPAKGRLKEDKTPMKSSNRTPIKISHCDKLYKQYLEGLK